MIEQIAEEIATYGIIGCLLTWLIVKDWKMTSRFFKLVENNTKAMTELKDSILNLRR